VDGIQRPNWTKDSNSPADTYSIDVLNGEEALRYFGEKGLYGVIAITTKSFRLQHPLYFKGQVTISENAGKGLLYIIDGVETSAVDLKKLNPDNIESIDVLKGDKAVAAYGVKGANGVVLIHFKKKTGMGQPVITMDKLAITMSQPIITMDSPIIKMGQPVITMDTKDGPVTVQADTIKINKPKITITSKPDGN
jgi:TonB-dependent SusC/RagA subfamily outer membrane receptor